MQTNVFVVTHKQAYIPDNTCYLPIIVGQQEVFYENAVRDNTGDNISEKNKNYCELTALYWIWKNRSEEGFYGMCHYRRYFVNKFGKKTGFDDRKLNKYFKKRDIVLPYPFYWGQDSVAKQLLETSISQFNFDLIKKAITRLYPDYLPAYEQVFGGNYASYCNMFIMPSKTMLDRYCKWLFDILFEIEKEADLSTATDYEKRIYGFISERLLNVWVQKNGLRVKYLAVNDGRSTMERFTPIRIERDAIRYGWNNHHRVLGFLAAKMTSFRFK